MLIPSSPTRVVTSASTPGRSGTGIRTSYRSPSTSLVGRFRRAVRAMVGPLRRREDPPRALERACVGGLDPFVLGACHRVAADEMQPSRERTLDLEHDARLGTSNICENRTGSSNLCSLFHNISDH